MEFRKMGREFWIEKRLGVEVELKRIEDIFTLNLRF